MGEWLQNLPVGWMAVVVFTFAYLFAFGIFTIVMGLATKGNLASAFKGVSAGMLPPCCLEWDGQAAASGAASAEITSPELTGRPIVSARMMSSAAWCSSALVPAVQSSSTRTW